MTKKSLLSYYIAKYEWSSIMNCLFSPDIWPRKKLLSLINHIYQEVWVIKCCTRFNVKYFTTLNRAWLPYVRNSWKREWEASTSGTWKEKRETQIQTSFKTKFEKNHENLHSDIALITNFYNKWSIEKIFWAVEDLQMNRKMKEKMD